MSKPFVLWEGFSPVNNEPIVALVSWQSGNEKTGNMAQVYILHKDLHPLDAVNTGEDVSVCGYCPLRSKDGNKGRACYVRVEQGPAGVWKKYQRHLASGKPLNYVTPSMFMGRKIRWGAYGDPAMLPSELVEACSKESRGWTGYTHQHKYPWAKWAKKFFMASIETIQQERKLVSQGWGTFRAGLSDGSDKGDAILCYNESHGVTCLECGLCNGTNKAVYIPSHGKGKNFVPAAKLLRK